MLLVNPYSGKTVDVPDGLVDRYKAAGFTVAAGKTAPNPRGRRSTKSD